MSITDFHKLEWKFLDKFGFELDAPVHATFDVSGQSVKAIVTPKIDERGHFVLSYCEAEGDYFKHSGNPVVLSISHLPRSILDFAKGADDEVSVKLCAQNPLGSPGKQCLEVIARVSHTEPFHKGELYLHKGQIMLKEKEGDSMVKAGFSLVNLPAIGFPYDGRVELVAMGWRVVLSLDPEMTR